MNHDFLEEVVLRIREIKSHNKKTIFSISSTAKQEKNQYLTPIRVFEDFILSGCVVFDKFFLSILLKKIDGEIDIFLVDSEHFLKSFDNKIHSNNEKLELDEAPERISEICFNSITKSKVFEFKPNDLTVNATWSFLSQRLKFISGKKITILGAGNIGSKLALKFLESGAEVNIHRRNVFKGEQITNGLNLIKSDIFANNIEFHHNANSASIGADIVIGSTSGHPIIDYKIISNIDKNCIIVDLGKNNLTDEALELAIDRSIEIYRADVSPALESFIFESLRINKVLGDSYGKISLGYISIVSGGFYGLEGDIVVDKLNNPKRVFGICQGNGLLKNKLSNKDFENIARFKKEHKIQE